MLISTIDAESLCRAFLSGANRLCNHKEILNDLNVFPVPDGDTGSNMSMTVTSAAKDLLASAHQTVGEVMTAVSKASLRGARGNSGVILSQLFRGMAKRLQDCRQADARDVAEALSEGVKSAYRAVMKPMEGTILSVSRDGAEAAMAALDSGSDIVAVFEAAVTAAQKSLDRTPEILPQLKQAGVVDSGGQGLLYLLEGALFYFRTGTVEELTGAPVSINQTLDKKAVEAHIQYAYCTEFIINKNNPATSTALLRRNISKKGDCMVVIDDDEIVKVHIHTNNPGYVLEQAVKLGELVNIKIDNMKYQHHNLIEEAGENKDKEPEKEYGFAAVAAGKGLEQIFQDLGVDVVIPGGQTMNPSTDDILSAVSQVKAKTVIILPNNKNIIMAAQQAMELTDRHMIVIPTRSVPEGIAAKLAFDPKLSPEENQKLMDLAIKPVKTGSVTCSVRNFQFQGKDMEKGKIIGLAGGDIREVGDKPDLVLKALLADLTDENSEIITVFYGEAVTGEHAEELTDYLEETYPDCDVVMHNGGQPLYDYICSVE